mmetsp:Transcript_24648/g.36142  ORF Transcript_24648/g.36142 Transcript_24648/m.36142 type:complete len:661 (+) Transcript_24648:113-2095(+)
MLGRGKIAQGRRRSLSPDKRWAAIVLLAALLISLVGASAASTSAPSPYLSSMTRTASGRKSRSENVVKARTWLGGDLRGGGGDQLMKTTPLTTEVEAEGSKWFPVRRSELPQFASMTGMMFLFIYVFTTVHDTKDTLVVSHCGAEALPLLKLFGTLPCTIAFIALYSKCGTFMDKQGLFRLTLVPFFVFYALFAFVLYPFRENLNFMGNSLETSSSPLLALLRHWTFSLYFVVSEIWASAGIPLLFWQCANDVTPLEQAKRFYPLFAVFGNLAPIASGKIMTGLVSFSDNNFTFVLQSLASLKLLAWFGIIALHKQVYRLQQIQTQNEIKRKKQQTMDNVVSNMQAAQQGKRVQMTLTLRNPGKKKMLPKPKSTSLRESVKSLSKSSELRSLATMVICYNICIELIEVSWKALLRETFQSDTAEFMKFMAKFSQIIGICTLVMQLLASNLIGICGWTFSSLLTPLFMGTLAILFFWSITLNPAGATNAGGEIASMALFLGTAANIVAKVFKYSLFDPCKEMAYIPLGEEAKIQGKAAVDVFGARLGRSVGSIYQQVLVSVVNGGALTSILQFAPQLGLLYGVTIVVWYNSVLALGSLFGVDKNVSNLKTQGGSDNRNSSSRKKDTENTETMAAAAAMIQDAAKRRMEKQENTNIGSKGSI